MTDVTGPQNLPFPEEDPSGPDVEPNADEDLGLIIRGLTAFHHRTVQRNPWLSVLIDSIVREAYSAGCRWGYTRKREVDHQAEHLDVPLPLILALQRGVDITNPLNGADVTIEGVDVTIGVSQHGTGIPEPESKRVWDDLCETVRKVKAAAYCETVIAPLPREIATVIWTDALGRRVQINPTSRGHGQGLRRAFALCVLAPIHRFTGLAGTAAATTVTSAALIVGVPGDVYIPEQPVPDLRPKTSISTDADVTRTHQSAALPHHPRPPHARGISDGPPQPMGTEPDEPATDPNSPDPESDPDPEPEPSTSESTRPTHCPSPGKTHNPSSSPTPTAPAPSVTVPLPEPLPSAPIASVPQSDPADAIIDDVESALPIPMPTGP